MTGKLMTSEYLLSFYNDLENLGIKIWIDGGWGVDALLGKQTRLHEDLDIAIQQKDIPKLREFLEAQGYKDARSEDAKPWNFVLGDNYGHEIDIHAIVFDEKGNGLYGPIEKGVMYPADSLTGTGKINNKTVMCISPEWMVKFHSGYELKDKDRQDVAALCDKFGIKNPIHSKISNE
jgi:lincosamide nucleotidyltransferase A/C/D/E